jgi:hypothetical protein
MASHTIEFKALLAQFIENCQQTGHYNSPEQQAILIEMLNLVKANPEERHAFVDCFVDIVNDPNLGMAWIVVLFCMRELQWPEVREAIANFIASRREISDRVWRHMLTAYEKDREWRFRGHFTYHDQREPAAPAKTGWFARLLRKKERQ